MKKEKKILILLIVFLIISVFLGISLGYSSMNMYEILMTLTGNGNFKENFIIFSIRLPRVIILLMTGFSLAIAGGLLQIITKNDLADTGIIGINSGAGERWESKALPIKEVIKLIELILAIPEPKIHIFLFGGAQELNRHQTITQAITSSRLIDTGNHHQLLEFAALIKQMDYLISSDSLALHLAIAQQVKNLSFYAPTSAAEIATFGTGVKVVSSSPDYCDYKKEARKNDLTAEKIFATFQSWVKSP